MATLVLLLAKAGVILVRLLANAVVILVHLLVKVVVTLVAVPLAFLLTNPRGLRVVTCLAVK